MKLIINNIDVTSNDGKNILEKFNLEINEGEIHVIMGPNGTGKSTLSKVIMGSNDYEVTSGDITVNDKSILNMEVDERSRLGIFLSFQSPLSIEGVTNSEFLRTALGSKQGEPVGIYQFMKMMEKEMKELKMDQDMMHRSINKDFSGGERKKNEILQMKLLKPELVILDELDSGLDVDSLKTVCDNIIDYMKENSKTSLLIITHYSRILDYLKPDFVHIMKNGSVIKTGDFNLAKQIEETGFECVNDMSKVESYE